MSARHFLTLLDLSAEELDYLIQRGITIKNRLKTNGPVYTPFSNRTLAMIFEKSSTRTRVSFETAMAQFGGHALFLSSRDTQLGRGEPIADTARVLSEMVDAVMIRTFSHAGLEAFAAASAVPVINALTERKGAPARPRAHARARARRTMQWKKGLVRPRPLRRCRDSSSPPIA